MNVFSLDEAAIAEIRRIISESDCEDPIVSLLEVLDLDTSMNDFNETLLKGADYEELAEAINKRLEEIEHQRTYVLEVSAYERKGCRPEDLIEISGITFAMVDYLREALRDYHLTFNGRHFFLVSEDDVAGNLRSVKTIAKLFKDWDIEM